MRLFEFKLDPAARSVGALVLTGALVTQLSWAAEPRLDALEQGQRDWAPSAAVTPVLGGLTFYDDRTVFDAAFPGLPTEDFELGNVADGGLVACPAPADATSDDGCFTPGDLLDGIVISDLPGPDTTDGLLLIGDGTFGNTTRILGSNTLADSLEISFPDPVEAVGLDLINLPGPADSLTIDIFGPADLLLGSVSAPSAATGDFWGVSSTPMSPIARLELTSTINEAEAIDNVSFAIVPTLTLESFSTADSCVVMPTNNNGIWEPGEEIEVDVTLLANAGDFTGISGIVSSADPGVVIFDSMVAWPDILEGTTANTTAPLRFTISDPALCGGDVELVVDVSSDQGDFQIPLIETVGEEQAPDVPVQIPDANDKGAISTLEVGTAVMVSSLAVEVDITHTFVGDLTILLTSPADNTIVLLDRPGVPMDADGCNNNDVRVTFTDDAATDPEDVCNPLSSDPWITGEVLPVEALAAFDGEMATGTWTLEVIDNLAGDLGTVVDWRLRNADPLGAACVDCAAESDLQITKSCIGRPEPGCVLTVTNLGSTAAFGVEVVDPLPDPIGWAGDDCGAGPPAGNVLTWTIGNLEVGETVVCDIDLTAPETFVGSVTNIATVSSDSFDPDVTNNTAEVSFLYASILEIPTLSEWSMLVFALLLAGLSLARFGRGGG
ncbi:MAG: IPTL-CTERM sorting domain-containing protein [Acidobacteriota bacterium]